MEHAREKAANGITARRGENGIQVKRGNLNWKVPQMLTLQVFDSRSTQSPHRTTIVPIRLSRAGQDRDGQNPGFSTPGTSITARTPAAAER